MWENYSFPKTAWNYFWKKLFFCNTFIFSARADFLKIISANLFSPKILYGKKRGTKNSFHFPKMHKRSKNWRKAQKLKVKNMVLPPKIFENSHFPNFSVKKELKDFFWKITPSKGGHGIKLFFFFLRNFQISTFSWKKRWKFHFPK